MNPVHKQGEGVFVSVCQNCDMLALVSIEEDWSPPLEQLSEDWLITSNRLAFAIGNVVTQALTVAWEKIKARFRRPVSQK